MEQYLVFDHFQFKLAVIQKLMYELHLFSYEYHEGDRYIELWKQGVYGEYDDESLERHIKNAIGYFEKLEIPVWMADRVYSLLIAENNAVYFQMNPRWKNKAEYHDGKDFTIVSISKKELQQFKNLNQITFKAFCGGQKLVHLLEKRGIQVVYYDFGYKEKKSLKETFQYHNHKPIVRNEKRVNPLFTIFIFICLIGFFTIMTIQQFQVQQEEVNKQLEIETFENANRERLTKNIVLASDQNHLYSWLEDNNQNKLTQDNCYNIEGPYFDNQMLLFDTNGYSFYDLDKQTYGDIYKRIEKLTVYKDNKRIEGFLVTQDGSHWYLLTQEELYEKVAIIGENATTSFTGQTQFNLCHVVVEGDQPIVKSILDTSEPKGGE